MAQGVRALIGVGVAVALSLAGCRSAAAPPARSAQPPGSTVSKDPAVVGTYAGTLPCADCGGISTTLTLMSKSPLHTGDGTFVLTEEYLGSRDGDRRVDSRGRWIILRGTPDDRDATVYQLTFNDATRLMFVRRISEEVLRVLDREQREIRSNASYTLTRAVAPSVGGYRSIDPTDADARSAAEYAVSEQGVRTGTTMVLRRIVRTERQVVAGVNYRFCLDVGGAGGRPDVEVIVHRDLQQRLSLTRWSPGCGGT